MAGSLGVVDGVDPLGLELLCLGKDSEVSLVVGGHLEAVGELHSLEGGGGGGGEGRGGGGEGENIHIIHCIFIIIVYRWHALQMIMYIP